MRVSQWRVKRWVREYEPSRMVRRAAGAAAIAVWLAVGSSVMWAVVQVLP